MFTNRDPNFLHMCADDEHRADDAECVEIRPQIPVGTLDALWTAINTGDARAVRELLKEKVA